MGPALSVVGLPRKTPPERYAAFLGARCERSPRYLDKLVQKREDRPGADNDRGGTS